MSIAVKEFEWPTPRLEEWRYTNLAAIAGTKWRSSVEAAALAAGHRPCAECRHQRFLAFCNAWEGVHPGSTGSARPCASQMDNQLHAERVAPDRSKRLFLAPLDELPNGVFIQRPERGEQAYLLWDDGLLAWSPHGYQERRSCPKDEQVAVLTPRSTVEAMRAGYVPEIHASAGLA